jgi:hypothetical protein
MVNAAVASGKFTLLSGETCQARRLAHFGIIFW